MNAPPLLSGLYVAPVTPVDAVGRVDGPRLRALIEFLLDGGVEGFCLGGATAEYPHFPVEERKRYLEEAADQIAGRAPYVVAVGGPTVRDVLHLGAHAIEHGARALLVPMPYFYRYGQEDLSAYVQYVTAHLDHPCILYNLAPFTNPLEVDTSIRLLREIPNLVGIKDSSGDREAVYSMADARGGASWSLLSGSDSLIVESLEAGWDGVVSGTACCCPELVALLFRRHRNGNTASARVAQQLVGELIDSILRLPIPWAIRVALEVRGLPTGPFPHPVAESRRIDELRTFYEDWFDEHLSPLRDELSETSSQREHPDE